MPLLLDKPKARDVGFIDASGGNWRFDLAEYDHYEQVITYYIDCHYHECARMNADLRMSANPTP
jgi:hypothetical protein